MTEAVKRADSPRDLLTDDERDRTRVFGIPPLLLIAARGAPASGYFSAVLRDRQDVTVVFDRCVICPEHQWITMINTEHPETGGGETVNEVRLVDIQAVSASGVFDQSSDGLVLRRGNGAIDIHPPPVQGEIDAEAMAELVGRMSGVAGLRR